ncbi:chemotaxis response regulator (protein-glutamate methylesterase) [Phenylobacterium zucineum HLK1]|uniref:Protein-glutamate methylesterase/protein-glutamine glutaminase n=2 Tax=Phenylobacterium zucineum TaxID=284016 RepID=B4RFM8_PHEZH|nr:chemotaxis response regulator (protein-glutamate methylesterase) [Phenylobacterium zucineum HLK1]
MKSPERPVRVMIVEDSLVVRQLLAHLIGRDPRFVVAAAVASAEEALAEIGRVKPDVISMDIRLPGIDGLEATRRIMSEHPTPIVVIADSVEDRSLSISMNALRAGALSVVEKPVGVASAAYERIAETITTQLFIMSSVPVIRRRSFAAGPAAAEPPPPPRGDAAFRRPAFVALAASTGGPPALAKVLEGLPKTLEASVFVVQHMGEAFMEGFATWLAGLSPLPVALAEDGATAQPGRVYVAPGGRHLSVEGGGRMRLVASEPVSSQRPSANVLFSSLARSAAPQTVGVLLTGMGEDGAQGLLELRRAGGYTIAEHQSSAVVYGMPAAAVRLKAAKEILPLDMIGPRLVHLAQRARP